MKSKPQFTDSPEFDEFFRQGDEQSSGADSLQPVVAYDEPDVSADTREIRTPAQCARRARFIKYVSMTMAFLTIGSAGATLRVVAGSHHTGGVPVALAPRVAQPEMGAAEPVVIESAAPTKVPLDAEVSNPTVVESERSEQAAATSSKAQRSSEQAAATSSKAQRSSEQAAATSSKAQRSSEQVSTSGARSSPSVSPSANSRRKQPRTSSLATPRANPELAKPDNYRPPTASFAD